MTAQGVMGSTGSVMNIMFPGVSSAEGSVKETQENSFESFMESSKSGKKQDIVSSATEKSSKENSAQPKDIKERAKELFSGKSKVRETGISKDEKAVKDFEEVAEAVSTLLAQIRQVVCDTLGITEEQLTSAMDELNIEDADLLERDSLQQIFLKLNQAEPTELLTNEEMLKNFTGLAEAVEQVFTESNLTPEEFKAVTEEIVAVTEEEDGIVFETVTEDTGKPQEQRENEITELPEENTEPQRSAIPSEAKAETSDNNEEHHMANAKREGTKTVISSETDVSVKNVFIDTLVSYAVNEAGEATVEAAAQVREIANQIMEQIKVTIRPEQTNMELQLNPEHLGRVNLTITEKEGMMTAQFTTQTEVAKEAIESQMAALRESLQNQGIKVEAIEVTVSEFGFEQNREAGQNGSGEPEKRRQRNTFFVEDAEDGGPQITEYLNATDSSVDYSA